MGKATHVVDVSFSSEDQKVIFDSLKLMEFLEKQRVDSLLEYPVFFHQIQRLKQASADYQSYPVTLKKPMVGVSYLACSRTEQGNHLVQQINGVLGAEVRRNQFLDKLYEGYYPHEIQQAKSRLATFYSD